MKDYIGLIFELKTKAERKKFLKIVGEMKDNIIKIEMLKAKKNDP